MKTRYSKTVFAGGIALTMSVGLSPPAYAEIYQAPIHTFSVLDVQGGFDGSTYREDPSILCLSCDVLQEGDTTLYPVDSEFGFYVEDFVGAAPKHRDNDYLEGHVGDMPGGVGLYVANAATDTFKVKYPMGTWCSGLGGNSVKCSTERYTVLEHIMTCNETIPYYYTTGDGSVQADLIDPDPDAVPQIVGTCADGALNDNLTYVENGVITEKLLYPDPTNPAAPNLVANESTVLDDIAVSTSYAITKKDDGKPLYRFGNMIKRPNDIRLYARMELPAAWKGPEAENYPVTSATLTITHKITNNPNDQIRPEDMENEAAIGRLPEAITGPAGLESVNYCFEGDGDEIVAGTVFRNDAAALGAGDGSGNETTPSSYSPKPYPYSADLVSGYTNAWFTTTDRNPFGNADSTDAYYNPAGGTTGSFTDGNVLNGGPRWRLKPNKFGQDIPGLEIPSIACLPVPYSSSNIRYPVGDDTTTVINLLDWEDTNDNGVQDDSPLAWSKGLSLIHISEPTRLLVQSRMPSSA